MPGDHLILVLNSGSSSLKYALFGTGQGLATRLDGATIQSATPALQALFGAIDRGRLARPDAVGHRIVHGGPRHQTPQRIERALLSSLRESMPFAPLHLPSEIACIEAVEARYPGIPQVACFDTAFTSAIPEVTRRFALPRSVYDRGVHRYGFHGLSYEYIVDKLGALLGGRAVIAHLGNGASMVALRDRAPIDTTMGLTPAGGFMMGTRPGDIDPGVLLYLLRSGMGQGELERLINHQSGLLGVSETTSDVKELLRLCASDERAALALEMFAYQARKSVGSLAAALGGLDTLVFTGGVGEHAAPVRERICAGLEWAGVRLDQARNDRGDALISAPDSPCTVRVYATDEEVMIAKHTQRLLFS